MVRNFSTSTEKDVCVDDVKVAYNSAWRCCYIPTLILLVMLVAIGILVLIVLF